MIAADTQKPRFKRRFPFKGAQGFKGFDENILRGVVRFVFISEKNKAGQANAGLVSPDELCKGFDITVLDRRDDFFIVGCQGI